jgi:D-alanyl-D-alanine carboxypeptidase
VAPPREEASTGPQESPPARALAYASPLTEQPSISARETRDTSLSPASAPPTRATSARGNWVIQIGAFPAEEQAKGRLSEAQNLGKALLANASSFTERVMKGHQELYRARFAGFDRNAAEAACSYFKRNDIECISVMAGR